jgi:drug/metabolite transporter (DMT)-like permease
MLLGAALAFSTKSVLVKLTYAADPGLDAVRIMALRAAFSVPFFLGVALWTARRSGNGTGLPPMTAREWLGVAALGVLGFYLATLMDTAGLAYVSAGTERLVLFIYPTLVVVLGAVFLGERIRRPLALALAATYLGVVLAAAGRIGMERDLARGVTLVLGAALSFAVFTAWGARLIGRVGSARFTAHAMTAAGAVTAVHYLLAHGPDPGGATRQVVLLCMAMALIATVLPAFLMAEGIRRVGAGPAAVMGTIGPVVTLGLDRVVFGETVGALQLAGTVLILAGVLAVGRARTA